MYRELLFKTHNVPVDVPVFIVHSERVLLCLLGSLLDLSVVSPQLGDDPHTVLGGSTPPLSKLRLPLVTMTLLLQQLLQKINTITIIMNNIKLCANSKIISTFLLSLRLCSHSSDIGSSPFCSPAASVWEGSADRFLTRVASFSCSLSKLVFTLSIAW